MDNKFVRIIEGRFDGRIIFTGASQIGVGRDADTAFFIWDVVPTPASPIWSPQELFFLIF
jgi:hypothetical protein